ncbi:MULTISPECIES: hypothetical protein [Sphingobacterium]|uniref:hypothetical protein n=1 Tax=Sphingobacterium TaxID=28453 RepID=UPI00038A4DFA|nr:hypothetical protein [Sphingobacterium sp. IITKGP-BTPF85]KKX46925.1 hypothetical protein L950_0229225 [Sphingobacterium sp. IITKGP-BTPF85]
MKKNFDNQGVNAFQIEVFSLSSIARQAIINLARTDLATLLLDNFYLDISQQVYVSSMTLQFKTELGNKIAETWEAGLHVHFQKYAAAKDEHIKDLIVLDPNLINNDISETDSEQPLAFRLPISITIRYRQ